MKYSLKTIVIPSENLENIENGEGELSIEIFDKNIILNSKEINEYGLEITLAIGNNNEVVSVLLKKEEAVLLANQILKLSAL